MTSLEKVLSEHNGVCSFLKAQHAALGSGAARVQEAQAKSMALKCSRLALSPAEAAKLTEAFTAGPWTSEQRAELASAVAGSLLEQDGGKASRRPSQSMDAFAPYLRDTDLGVLRSSANVNTKLQVCVDLAVQLDLILPHEATVGVIVRTIAVLGCDNLKDPTTFLAAVNEFKRLLKLRTKSLKHSLKLTEYPPDPKALPACLYAAAFSGSPPAGLDLVLPEASARAAPLRRSALVTRALPGTCGPAGNFAGRGRCWPGCTSRCSIKCTIRTFSSPQPRMRVAPCWRT